MTPTPPKLASLTPEQRRILAAEILGWADIRIEEEEWADLGGGGTIRDYFGQLPPSRVRTQLPDPDNDERHAFRLIEHLRARLVNARLENYSGTWRVWMRDENNDGAMHYAEADTAPAAITSAALLASGAATD